MIRLTFCAVLLKLILTSSPLYAAPPETPIPYREFQIRGLLGELGLRMGTVCTIDATAVEGDPHGPKELAGVSLLKVHRVNGKKLPGEPRFEYTAGRTRQKNFPTGSRQTLVVYETGSFSGLVSDAYEEGDPVPAMAGFGFSNRLVVVRIAATKGQ